MEDAKNLNFAITNPVRNNVRVTIKDQFPCSEHSTWPTFFRMLRQAGNRTADKMIHSACGNRIVTGDIVHNSIKVAVYRPQPLNPHGGSIWHLMPHFLRLSQSLRHPPRLILS